MRMLRMLALCVALLPIPTFCQVTAVTPYTVSVFATSSDSCTQPDSIAILRGHVFVGYGNGISPTGSDGKSSTIVEYDINGNVVWIYSVKGHNDGLKVNPSTKELWAMQNEDANPNLVIINPVTHAQHVYKFGPTLHGGGYDDIVFRGKEVFFSASNPSNNPNTRPAIVRAELHGTMVLVTPVLLGDANATDIPTDTPVALNLQDPDSMILDPFDDIVLDSQADGELIIVHRPGQADQSVFHLALTLNGSATQIDDTVFALASHGILFVSDRDGETVYAITKDIFSPYAAYSATPNSVGRLDLDTGVITNVVTGMVSPHGMAFLRDEAAQE